MESGVRNLFQFEVRYRVGSGSGFRTGWGVRSRVLSLGWSREFETYFNSVIYRVGSWSGFRTGWGVRLRVRVGLGSSLGLDARSDESLIGRSQVESLVGRGQGGSYLKVVG